jgi:RNA polymerase sigma-70 factor, ECF subfamily
VLVVAPGITDDLVAAFVREVPGATARGHDLANALGEAWTKARAAWPAFEVEPARFAAALAGGTRDASDAVAAIAELAVADLYLAQACATGTRAALDAFAEQCDPAMLGALRQMSLAPDAIDELVHEVRTKLFVGDGAPRIATYSGRAALASWVRTIATRAAVDRLRKKDASGSDDEVLDALPDDADTPELAHFRATYHVELKAAFEAALATLDVRERNVLRHHFVDGLTLDEIGALYGVHKTTVFRWIENARTSLSKRTRAGFQQRVKALPDDLDSILRLLQSHIDLSLSRVLG